MYEKSGLLDKKTEASGKEKSSKARKAYLTQPSVFLADHVLYLQRTIGNQAVERLIKSRTLQTKLRIGQPDDIYEKEADRVAEEVMLMTCNQGDEECEIKRKCPKCEEEIQMLSQKTFFASNQNSTHEVALEIEVDINSMIGVGEPLPKSMNDFFEPRFGVDFSQVRVHTDAKADELARSVNALAFTVGKDIVFGAGYYAPETAKGKHLLAHELTHVVQQSNTRSQVKNKSVINKHSKTEIDSFTHANAILSPIGVTVSTFPQISIQQGARGLYRAVSTACLAPSEVLTPGAASQFGSFAEKAIIDLNYCSVMGCAPFATDYFDNPVASSYVAFIVAHNPRLNNPKDIATLAIVSLIGLNRPDILTDNGVRKEYYEIKPNSPTGLADGIAKLFSVGAFMGLWSLPYVPGTAYVPAPPMILIASGKIGPWPLEVYLRISRVSPGLVIYDVCFRGELAKIGLAALIAVLAAIVVILVAPESIPIVIPAIAAEEEKPPETAIA